MRFKKSTLASVLILSSSLVLAGDNTNPSPGPSGTKSYTLEDIYKRLDTGAAGNQTTFTNPKQGPEQPVGHTFNEIMEKAPEVNSDAAKPEDVAKGKKYWSLTKGNWGLKTGTGTGGGGVECSTGADRFKDNGDGTVTDNCTQLIWLKNANCFGWQEWLEAKNKASQLTAGQCGLTSGSSGGNWHLPSMRELQSLFDFSRYDPALPKDHPFSNVQMDYYWSSTESTKFTNHAWGMFLNDGVSRPHDESGTSYVWPVRSR